jgi:hypothetical protein
MGTQLGASLVKGGVPFDPMRLGVWLYRVMKLREQSEATGPVHANSHSTSY